MERYSFVIKDLDCAMCAKEVEEKLNSADWIESASVNFNTEKVVITTDRTDDFLAEINDLARSVEPDCTIVRKDVVVEKKRSVDWYLPLFVIGFVFGAVGILLEFLPRYVDGNFPHPILSYVFVCVGGAMMLSKTFISAIVKLVRSHTVDENLLMSISSICAIAIGETFEGLMIILLSQIGKFFESKAVDKTRNSVKSLMMVKPETVIVKDGDNLVETPIEDVEIGSLILVKAGEIVPLDGVVEDGHGSLNLSSLTGESVPQDVAVGDEITSGAVSIDGVLTVRTTSTDSDSTITKILALLETASERKTKTETVVSKVTKYFVPAVMVCAVVVGLAFGLSGYGVKDAIYKAMLFLVVSCPCAVAISVPLAYFSGIGNASKRGILVKGTNFLDAIGNVKTIAFDKTGTITTGNFEVTSIEHLDGNLDDALKFAYLAERNSSHPIAKAIVSYVSPKVGEWKSTIISDVREIAGKGVEFVTDGILVEVGKSDENADGTTVAIKADGKTLALIHLEDKVKDGARETIDYLKAHGVYTEMLTGDNETAAEKVATEIGVDSYKASLLPEGKFDEMEKLIDNKKSKSEIVAYIGDGINDAPVLNRADVGIAMGLGGSSATVDTADIVLMNDDVNELVSLVKISKKTKLNVAENVIAVFAVKIIFVVLGLVGITGLAWAVFADVGLSICAVLNTLRVLNYKPNGKSVKTR